MLRVPWAPRAVFCLIEIGKRVWEGVPAILNAGEDYLVSAACVYAVEYDASTGEIESIEDLKGQLAHRKVWVAASIHKGEEKVMLGVHKELIQSYPDLVTIKEGKKLLFSRYKTNGYSRGCLQLLDQRKLPLETVYLDIPDSSDGWSAIQEMVVRGAPAIAIAAALSLAVEVFNLKDFNGTSDDAASFLFKKLEYLVSSRPTAVNLSDAATKLKEIVLQAAAAASESKTVFQAYIEAAEIMLKDDVASNKAIGSYGASFIQNLLKNSEKLSVLTHCNTGSLATAGYGTALGVIRALHTDGVLERAYCTETRPFNQGSRLTAFELVHEKIPATLVADSAAAALMNAGRVSAVIVGADRVAANGDTANKIGTYSLALCASHHNIPFFVAAPLTSIDLSLSSGKEIIIEERSPKELLNTRGGLGEQVAASGINVWNPAFDVTPAQLITGIITEKGVITKTGSDVFDIKNFVKGTVGLSFA